MIKEIKEEIKFIIEHPILSLFILGNLTGILPMLALAILDKILGF